MEHLAVSILVMSGVWSRSSVSDLSMSDCHVFGIFNFLTVLTDVLFSDLSFCWRSFHGELLPAQCKLISFVWLVAMSLSFNDSSSSGVWTSLQSSDVIEEIVFSLLLKHVLIGCFFKLTIQ